MTLRQKLSANAITTVVGIVLIGLAGLISLYQLKEKVYEVTEAFDPPSGPDTRIHEKSAGMRETSSRGGECVHGE